jgi:thioredoxin 1
MLPVKHMLSAILLMSSPAALAQDGMMKKAMIPVAGAQTSQKFVAYSDAAFAAAQKAGQPIVVAVAADWCPVCKNQEMTLNKLMRDKGYANTAFFRIDFDSQKPAVTKFKAKAQSTLIAFQGKKEVARLFYNAEPAKVMALAAKATSM